MNDIEQAARRIAAGELVAFPTETVYGLGANAADPAAVARIYVLKGRPSTHPVIVHVAAPQFISHWARSVPDWALKLVTAFWPGPLTLILPRAEHVSDAVTGGQDSVGLRCPSHPVARALLQACLERGVVGVAAPSANRYGHVSPTLAAHVREEFGDAVPVLDGGASEVGIESTIIDCTGREPVLLRPGAITSEDVARVTGLPVHGATHASPRAAGTLPAHYQPATESLLVPAAALDGLASATDAGRDTGLFAPSCPAGYAGVFRPAPAQAAAYAQMLYATLRELDALQLKRIYIAAPPEGLAWEAIRDRLSRATAPVAAPGGRASVR